MTRYCADDFSNWQLKVHRLLGQGFGVEDIAIELGMDAKYIRHEIQELRQKGNLMMVIDHWAKPAITYREK
jgi:DNA-binding NarL/FixJ family response regulator